MTRLDRTNAVHHVYRCYDASGRLIYVGCTANLFNRLEQHRANSWWSPTIAKVRAELYPNGVDAREAERRAIREEVPRWNKAGKWAGRHNWTRTDWMDWLTIQLHGTTVATIRSLPSGIRTVIETYESLFNEPIPEPYASRVAALQVAANLRMAEEREAMTRRHEEVRRQDELDAKRDQRHRRSLGIPDDCICTTDEFQERLYCDECDVHQGLAQ